MKLFKKYQVKKYRAALCILISCFCFACGVDDAVDYYLDGCDESGAQNLRQEHRDVLEYAGWLEYVESNVGRIDYYDDRTSSSEGAVGYAHCQPGECFVEIATKHRTDIDVTTIIVHEAGHLDDNCQSGEYWPEKMEKAFLDDFYAKYDAGVLVPGGTPVKEIVNTEKIIDFYPYSQTEIALIIADKPGNELYSNLYIYNSNTNILSRVSNYAGKIVRFVRQYNDYPNSLFSYRLKNPWDYSGDNIVVSVEDNEEYMIDIININNKSQKTVYTGWASNGAVFSPDSAYIAVASRHIAQPVSIIDIESGEIIKTLPEKYNTSDGIMAWMDSSSLALYDKNLKQVEKYNIDEDLSEVIYRQKSTEIEVKGIYRPTNTQDYIYAMAITSQAQRNFYRINFPGENELLVSIDNDVVPALNPSGDVIAYYLNQSGDDSSYGKKLFIKNLGTGSATQLLDRVSNKDRLFFLDNNRLLISTVHSPGNSSRHYYRLWIVTYGT